jgi:hypothetical protein
MRAWDERALAIAKLIVSRSDIHAHRVDYTISSLGVKQPESALQLALSALERRLSLARIEAERRALLPRPDD